MDEKNQRQGTWTIILVFTLALVAMAAFNPAEDAEREGQDEMAIRARVRNTVAPEVWQAVEANVADERRRERQKLLLQLQRRDRRNQARELKRLVMGESNGARAAWKQHVR